MDDSCGGWRHSGSIRVEGRVVTLPIALLSGLQTEPPTKEEGQLTHQVAQLGLLEQPRDAALKVAERHEAPGVVQRVERGGAEQLAQQHLGADVVQRAAAHHALGVGVEPSQHAAVLDNHCTSRDGQRRV